MDKKFEKAKSYLATREDIMATKADIATFKAYIIKWMFILCLGWVGVFSGIMFALLNAYLKH